MVVVSGSDWKGPLFPSLRRFKSRLIVMMDVVDGGLRSCAMILLCLCWGKNLSHPFSPHSIVDWSATVEEVIGVCDSPSDQDKLAYLARRKNLQRHRAGAVHT
jgi:hypothetical protein